MKAVTRAVLALALVGCRSEGTKVDDRILVFEEWTLDSEQVPLDTDQAIVDINSTVRIKIDRDRLRARLLEDYGGATVAPGLLVMLDSSLENLRESLPKMQAAFDAWDRGPQGKAEREALRGALQNVGLPTLTLLDNLPAQLAGVEQTYNQAVEPALLAEPGLFTAFTVFNEVVSQAIDGLREEELQRLRELGVVVRLGAWSSAGGRMTPVHLGGFDDLDPGEFVEYERIVVALNDSQREAWEAIVAKAKAINASGAELDFSAMARRLVRHLDETLEDPLAGLGEDLEQAREEVAALAEDLRDRLDDSLNVVTQRLDQTKLLFRRTIAKYQALEPSAATLVALAHLRNDVAVLREDVEALLSVVQEEARKLEDHLSASAETLRGTGEALDARMQALAQIYRATTSVARLNLAALEFGEEVLALDLADVPASTSLDLRYTGPRQPGDQVAFVMKGGKSDQEPAQHRDLDERQFSMFRVLGHVSSTVSLVFANPSGSTGLQTDFQAAPTYNLLYKWGDRDSPFHNRFLTPGVGLSFSLLDFDGDDSLELGIGATVAAFQDWLQAGYGYNLGTDDAYWFLGFSLPLLNTVWNGTQ